MKLGALAAGIGAGYMAADSWKKKKAKGDLGSGDVSATVKADTGLAEPYDPTAGMEHGGYADGGLVCDPRWMKKHPR